MMWDLRRWWALRRFRRRYGERVCRNCVHMSGTWCPLRRMRIERADETVCKDIFTLYDAAVQRFHYDRYAK